MTRPERSGERNLDFSQWIRTHLRDSQRGLITQDLDFVFVNYCTGWFLLLEVKTHRQESRVHMPPASTVIYRMLDEMLRHASRENGQNPFSRNPATGAVYRYLGAYLLEFIDGTDPENSRQMYLNGQPIAREELITLLNLESDDSLQIARRYHRPWIDELLERQRSRLRGRCD